jgi:metal-responsive CopG/Arc/MetJ family transcriptional regulator
MDVIALLGPSTEVQRFGEMIGAIKGVQHSQLTITVAAEAH